MVVLLAVTLLGNRCPFSLHQGFRYGGTAFGEDQGRHDSKGVTERREGGEKRRVGLFFQDKRESLKAVSISCFLLFSPLNQRVVVKNSFTSNVWPHSASSSAHIPRLDHGISSTFSTGVPIPLFGSRTDEFFSFLAVTIHAKKSLSRRGSNLRDHLFSTTGADHFKGFLECSPLVIPSGKGSPSSGHLYHLIRIVISRVTPAEAQGEAPGFLSPPGAWKSAFRTLSTSPRQPPAGPSFPGPFRTQPGRLHRESWIPLA